MVCVNVAFTVILERTVKWRSTNVFSDGILIFHMVIDDELELNLYGITEEEAGPSFTPITILSVILERRGSSIRKVEGFRLDIYYIL